MIGFFRYLAGAVRRWPVLAAVVAGLVGGFGALTYSNYRLLGDDRELDGSAAAATGGGHGTHANGYTHRTYYHK